MDRRSRWFAVLVAVVAMAGGFTFASVATSQEDDTSSEGNPWDDPLTAFNWPDHFTRADKIAALEQILAHKRAALAELEQGVERREFTGENGDDPYDLARQEITALRDLIARLEEYLAAQEQ